MAAASRTSENCSIGNTRRQAIARSPCSLRLGNKKAKSRLRANSRLSPAAGGGGIAEDEDGKVVTGIKASLVPASCGLPIFDSSSFDCAYRRFVARLRRVRQTLSF